MLWIPLHNAALLMEMIQEGCQYSEAVVKLMYNHWQHPLWAVGQSTLASFCLRHVFLAPGIRASWAANPMIVALFH